MLLALLIVLSASATDPRRGYRGFVDANVDMTIHSGDDGGVIVYTGISTSHGFQFNSHYYLGAGIGWELVVDDGWLSSYQHPYYLHGRTDWTFGHFPLYGDIRVGGVLWGEHRFFLSPTIGYRLNWGRKANLNLGLGMTFRGYGWSDEKTLHPQLSVRIGVDF